MVYDVWVRQMETYRKATWFRVSRLIRPDGFPTWEAAREWADRECPMCKITWRWAIAPR